MTSIDEEVQGVSKLAWRLQLANDHFSNETDSANLIRSSVDFKGELPLLSTLSLRADLNLYWSTGRAQSWYGADGYSKGINFSEAIVRFAPRDWFVFSAGAVNLEYIDSPLLISSGPFPGAKLKVGFDSELLCMSLSALYSIPTSRSLNTDRIEKEEEPSFAALTLNLASGSRFDLAGAVLNTTFFSYDKLPSKVAYESSIKGNSVITNSDADSSFIYQYKGISSTLSAFFHFWDRYTFRVKYIYLLNSDGPSTGNRGELLSAQLEIQTAALRWTPYFELFYNEPDSSVAYYNSTKYGNNNREGVSVGLLLNYASQFDIMLRYTDADIIRVNNSIASRNQLLFVGISTSYRDIRFLSSN